MRTPNCNCCICDKPMYRRPFELAKVRYTACMEHREDAKRIHGLTKPQADALELGREKGTNHLEGIPKSAESNEKRSRSHKKWCAENPQSVANRGKKVRGDNHYNWKGDISKLSVSIRRLTENRKWMDGVKKRDGMCQSCGSTSELESHHIVHFSELLRIHDIQSRDTARDCKELWDLDNGITLCKKCHCERHGRKYTPNGQGRRQL